MVMDKYKKFNLIFELLSKVTRSEVQYKNLKTFFLETTRPIKLKYKNLDMTLNLGSFDQNGCQAYVW